MSCCTFSSLNTAKNFSALSTGTVIRVTPSVSVSNFAPAVVTTSSSCFMFAYDIFVSVK